MFIFLLETNWFGYKNTNPRRANLTADFRDVLLDIGYREEVVEDEIQAHLANGRLPCEMEQYADSILELSFDIFVTFRTKLADPG